MVQWFVCLSVAMTTSQGNGYGTQSYRQRMWWQVWALLTQTGDIPHTHPTYLRFHTLPLVNMQYSTLPIILAP